MSPTAWYSILMSVIGLHHTILYQCIPRQLKTIPSRIIFECDLLIRFKMSEDINKIKNILTEHYHNNIYVH